MARVILSALTCAYLSPLVSLGGERSRLCIGSKNAAQFLLPVFFVPSITSRACFIFRNVLIRVPLSICIDRTALTLVLDPIGLTLSARHLSWWVMEPTPATSCVMCALSVKKMRWNWSRSKRSNRSKTAAGDVIIFIHDDAYVRRIFFLSTAVHPMSDEEQQQC